VECREVAERGFTKTRRTSQDELKEKTKKKIFACDLDDA
jgi:hypothetical protein